MAPKKPHPNPPVEGEIGGESKKGGYFTLFMTVQSAMLFLLNSSYLCLWHFCVTKTSSHFSDFVTPPGPMDKGIAAMCDVLRFVQAQAVLRFVQAAKPECDEVLEQKTQGEEVRIKN